jgi:type III pantothenate kinase
MNIVVDKDRLAQQLTFSSSEELKTFLQNYSASGIIISSVARDATEVASWATQVKSKYILNSTLPLPVKIRYATPETLGVDRIAGVCGAQRKFPGEPCLVIDAGTCITYDFLDRQGSFLGGGISPGLMMRFQAVHTFTSKLPLVSPVEKVNLIGDSTEHCIQSGIVNGLAEELNGIIRRYQGEFEGLRVILCGGDARFFENILKGPIFAVPELVLSGLNSILNYNGG